MKPSASTAGAGAADKARERRKACSADRISSDRVAYSPDVTNESTSWSSLRLHRSAMRASSVASWGGSLAFGRAGLPSGALSNTAKDFQVNSCYLNKRTPSRKKESSAQLGSVSDVSNRDGIRSNARLLSGPLSITPLPNDDPEGACRSVPDPDRLYTLPGLHWTVGFLT